MPGTGRFSMKRSRRIGGLQGGICMVQEIFKRYEKKYLLTESDCSRLMLTIGGILKPDNTENIGSAIFILTRRITC